MFFAILNLSLIAAFLVGRAEVSKEGAWTDRLRSCFLDYHAPIQAVALARRGLRAAPAVAG